MSYRPLITVLTTCLLYFNIAYSQDSIKPEPDSGLVSKFVNKVNNTASYLERKVIDNSKKVSKIDQAIALPDKLFGGLDKKCFSIEEKLNRQTHKYLTRLQNREHKLKEKLWKSDSTLAKQLFEGVNEKYNQLKTGVSNIGTTSSVYSGHLDSITTALNFLNSNNLTNNPALQKSLEQYKKLQSNFNASEQARKYITQRRELLKRAFEMSQKLREIVIIKDTVQEFNKHFGTAEDTYIEDGIKMYTVDSLNKVISLGVFKDNKLNGDYFAFYIDVNMLEKKGAYKNDMKHGTWYYWDRKGMLLRTEVWRDDKLISKKIMIKTK